MGFTYHDGSYYDTHRGQTPLCDRPRVNKYLYVKVVQGDYLFGHGWEDLSVCDTHWDAVRDLREYNACGHACSLRIISRRIPNPAYVSDEG